VSEIRWKGTWWLPEDPGNSKPGTLHYADDGQLRLELIGGFSADAPTWVEGLTASLANPGFAVIHGVCGSERFTLLETHALHSSGGFFGDISDQTLSALRGLRGIHVASAQEPVFDSADV
jgi:ApeA N-terminal domain 1